MNKQIRENYLTRYNGLNLTEEQLEQQWKARLEEEEYLAIAEAVNARMAAQQAIQAGGVASGGNITQNACVEYVVDTTDNSTTDFSITVSAETTVTITWGDGETSETVASEGSNSFDHTYGETGEGIQYTINLCFDNPQNVTEINFFNAY